MGLFHLSKVLSTGAWGKEAAGWEERKGQGMGREGKGQGRLMVMVMVIGVDGGDGDVIPEI